MARCAAALCVFAARPSPTFCTAPCRRTRHGRGRTGEEGGFFPQKLRDLIKYRFKILCSFACLRALACAAPSAHPLHVHGPLSLSQRRPPCLFLPFSLFPPPPHPPCFLLSQTFSPLAATFPAATATPCALSEPRRSVQPCSVDPYIPPTPPTTNAVRPQWIKSRGQSRGRRPGPPTMRFRPNSLSLSLCLPLPLVTNHPPGVMRSSWDLLTASPRPVAPSFRMSHTRPTRFPTSSTPLSRVPY